MNWLRTIAAELFGLFVDDGAFAIGIAVWLAMLWCLLPRMALGASWGALILVAGLVAILVDSVMRGARRQR
jgi:uncharacterized membrane protein YgaE (UPF0421/DUF939 family)